MQAFQLCQQGNMQLTANALCLLGEIYMALGTDESIQMFQISIGTAEKLSDHVTQSVSTHL